MSKIIQALEAEQMKDRNIPEFRSGDTVVIQMKIKEGERERLQSFEGIVIAKRNRGVNSSFTVRKVSHGEGVERVSKLTAHSLPALSSKEPGTFVAPNYITYVT